MLSCTFTSLTIMGVQSPICTTVHCVDLMTRMHMKMTIARDCCVYNNITEIYSWL